MRIPRGLTGTQIERLLQEIEIADVSPGVERLFNALAQAQNPHQIGTHLIMLINRAMGRTRGDRERRKSQQLPRPQRPALMRLVDTSAWIEWLISSPTGKAVKSELPVRRGWLIPKIVQLELAK